MSDYMDRYDPDTVKFLRDTQYNILGTDCISRQAAIDALDKRFDNVPMEQTTEILLLRKDLRELPSAQPERKKGKWDFIGWQMFQCSECKHTFTQGFLEGWGEYTYESLFPPFCPNCGANMKGEQDD